MEAARQWCESDEGGLLKADWLGGEDLNGDLLPIVAVIRDRTKGRGGKEGPTARMGT